MLRKPQGTLRHTDDRTAGAAELMFEKDKALKNRTYLVWLKHRLPRSKPAFDTGRAQGKNNKWGPTYLCLNK